MKHAPSLVALVAAAVLTACATSQTPPPELLRARDAVHGAGTDRQVLDHAALELKKATDALQRAERLNAKGESLAEVESAAYVARRQAEAAVAIGRAKGNELAIRAAEADRERARADARSAEARRASVEAAAARADASQAQVQASLAEQQAEAARQQAGNAEARAEAARRQAAELQQQLSELQAQPTDRGMLVTLGDMLFEFGRADVKPSAQHALQKLAAYLQQHPERRVLIEGHTDNIGSDAANIALSQRRAEAVAAALTSLGVTPDRIVARGYGESFPIADNGSDTNRALNRRVEVYISDNDRPVRARG